MANFCTYWCPNKCGKSVEYNLEKKYHCKRCNKDFSRKELKDINSRIK